MFAIKWREQMVGWERKKSGNDKKDNMAHPSRVFYVYLGLVWDDYFMMI